MPHMHAVYYVLAIHLKHCFQFGYFFGRLYHLKFSTDLVTTHMQVEVKSCEYIIMRLNSLFLSIGLT